MHSNEPHHMPAIAPDPQDAKFADDCTVCDGSGEVGCGRDWQVMRCEHCNGTGCEPEEMDGWDKYDIAAHNADNDYGSDL